VNTPIVTQVREEIAKYMEVPVEMVLVTSTFEALGLDSLNLIELSMNLEDVFHIEVPPKAVEEWKKVSDVVLYLDKVLKNNETVIADLEKTENV
jgi:acyl carrier protein